MRPANLVRRYNKRKSKALVKDALWAWWARARILEVWSNTLDVNRRNNGTLFSGIYRDISAYAYEQIGFGKTLHAARASNRYFHLLRRDYLNKYPEGRRIQKRGWTKPVVTRRLRSRFYKAIRNFREGLALKKKLSPAQRYKAFSGFKQRMRQAALLQALTAKVIKDRKAYTNPEAEIRRLYNEAVNRSNMKVKRSLLQFKRLELAARRARKPFNQTFIEYCMEASKARAAKARQERQIMANRRKYGSFTVAQKANPQKR